MLHFKSSTYKLAQRHRHCEHKRHTFYSNPLVKSSASVILICLWKHSLTGSEG